MFYLGVALGALCWLASLVDYLAGEVMFPIATVSLLLGLITRKRNTTIPEQRALAYGGILTFDVLFLVQTAVVFLR